MTAVATDAPAAPRVSRHARRGGLKAGERRWGMLFLLPALAAFLVIILYPFLRAIGTAFYEDTIRTITPEFIGLENFATLFRTGRIFEAFWTTAIYVTLCTGGTMVLGLAWALILNQRFWGRTAIRSLTLLPWVLPSTVCAFIWAWILNSRYGVLNGALLDIGLIGEPVAFLSTSAGAMAAVVLTKIWFSIPLFMAFFLAGLQGLDQQQLDAARVDGAGNWALLRDIALPHLRPVLIVVVIIGMIGNLQQIDTILALTGGGPVRATSVLSIEVYRKAFEEWDVGMAAAIGVLWIATMLPLAYLYLRRLFRSA